MKKFNNLLTFTGIDWQREKWRDGVGSKFIRQGEKNAVKYADEIIVLSNPVTHENCEKCLGGHFMNCTKGDFSCIGVDFMVS